MILCVDLFLFFELIRLYGMVAIGVLQPSIPLGASFEKGMIPIQLEVRFIYVLPSELWGVAASFGSPPTLVPHHMEARLMVINVDMQPLLIIILDATYNGLPILKITMDGVFSGPPQHCEGKKKREEGLG